jgi:hypothetical protein
MNPPDPTDPEASAQRSKYRGKAKAGPRQKLAHFFRENEWFWAIAFLLVVFSLFAVKFRVQPPPSLPVGAVAERDIRAPFDLQIIDRLATERRQREAADAVLPMYDWDPTLGRELVARVAQAFQSARNNTEQYRKYVKETALTRQARRDAEEQYLDHLSETLGAGLPRFALKQFQAEGLSPELEQAIVAMASRIEAFKIVPDGDKFQRSGAITIRDIRRNGPVWIQKDLSEAQIVTLASARRMTGPMAEELTQFSAPLKAAIEEYVRSLIQPNLTFNSRETSLRKEQASADVEPLVVFVRRGQLLVKAGAVVDEGAAQKVVAFREAGRNVVNWPLLAALFLFLLLLLGFTFMYLKTYRKHNCPHLNLFVLTLQVASLFILLAHAMTVSIRYLAEGSPSPYLERPDLLLFVIPVAAGTMLMTLLVDRHIGIIYTLVYSVLFGILTGFQFGLLLYCMLSCFTAVYAVSKMAQRTAQWKAGLLVGAVNVPLAAGVLATEAAWEGGWHQVGLPLALAFLSSFPLAVMLVTFLLPPLESFFGLLTEVRLLELSNMNHPLLKSLALEAPGTYNHSLMMANLCEAAANAIGANALFCRVACYYHDVGKMLNPLYFVENQPAGLNPHDKLQPRISALIVAAHVKEGIAMGRQYKLPQAIIDVIPQHHGTRRISYFFDKALTMVDPEKESLSEADFHYQGPRPQTREAAIIMLADGVEAGSRLLKDPSHHRLRTLVGEIVDRVVSEEQFAECTLTFRDLAKVEDAFLQILMGAFSRRVSYPGYTFDKETGDEQARGPAPLPPQKAANQHT